MHWLGEHAESKGTKRKVTPPPHSDRKNVCAIQDSFGIEPDIYS